MKSFFTLLILLIINLSSFAQVHRIRGRVIDEEGNGIENVDLHLLTNPIVDVTTDGEGKFSIRIPDFEEVKGQDLELVLEKIKGYELHDNPTNTKFTIPANQIHKYQEIKLLNVGKIDKSKTVWVSGLPFCTEHLTEEQRFFSLASMTHIYSILEEIEVLNVISQDKILDEIKTQNLNSYAHFCTNHNRLEFAQMLRADYMVTGDYEFFGVDEMNISCRFTRVKDGRNMRLNFIAEGKTTEIRELHKSIAQKIADAFGILLTEEHQELIEHYTVKATNRQAYGRYINARYYLKNRQYAKAEQEAEAGVKLDDKSPNLYLEKGTAELEQGKEDEAQESLENAEKQAEKMPEKMKKNIFKRIKSFFKRQKSIPNAETFQLIAVKRTDGDAQQILTPHFPHPISKKKGSGLKWGFEDRRWHKGTYKRIVVIKPKYDDASDFSTEFLAGVKKDGKWGYIDTLGKEIIPFLYDEIHMFYHGLAIVKKNKKWGIINVFGKEMTPFVYDVVKSFDNGLAIAQKNGKWGVVNKSGKEIIPFIYDVIYGFSDEYYDVSKVKKGNKHFYINKKGECVKDCP